MVYAYYFNPKPFFRFKSISLLGWEDGKAGETIGLEQALGKHICAFLFWPLHIQNQDLYLIYQSEKGVV